MPPQPFPDMVTDILLRLPAKSLLRFRCLSNSFRNEIDSPYFVQTHLKRSIATGSHRKLIFTKSRKTFDNSTDKRDIFAADFDDGLKKAFKIHNQFTDLEHSTAYIISTCLGLILLYVEPKDSQNPEQESELILWNPTTQQVKKLPPCPRGWGLSSGLGFDSASDDYKVVCIFPDHISVKTATPGGGLRYQIKERRHKVWVYSLKSNSWRYVQHLDLNICISSRPEVFANGFLYWKYSEGQISKIGCFDLANEVYNTLPNFYSPHDDDLPAQVNRNTSLSIKVVEGNVMLHTNLKENEVHEFYSPVGDNVSGLVEGGGNWCKAFTFDSHGFKAWKIEGLMIMTIGFGPPRFHEQDRRVTCLDLFPLAYSKDGDCVLLHIGKDIFWYNMEKKTKQRVKFLKEMNISYRMDCYVFWESLVPLGNDDEVQV